MTNGKINFIEDIYLVERKQGDAPVTVRRLRECFWKAQPRVVETDLEDPDVAALLPLIRNEVVVAEVPALQGQTQNSTPQRAAFTFVNLTTLAVNKD
jgi:hypothetical protein